MEQQNLKKSIKGDKKVEEDVRHKTRCAKRKVCNEREEEEGRMKTRSRSAKKRDDSSSHPEGISLKVSKTRGRKNKSGSSKGVKGRVNRKKNQDQSGTCRDGASDSFTSLSFDGKGYVDKSEEREDLKEDSDKHIERTATSRKRQQDNLQETHGTQGTENNEAFSAELSNKNTLQAPLMKKLKQQTQQISDMKRKEDLGLEVGPTEKKMFTEVIKQGSSRRRGRKSKLSKWVCEQDVLENLENLMEGTSDEPFIIGQHKFKTNAKASFCSKSLDPIIVSKDLSDVEPFTSLTQLHPALIKNLCRNNIKAFFPVQSAVLHWLLDRLSPWKVPSTLFNFRDICVSSPTGSGKTLSYVLPLVHLLCLRSVPFIQGVVLVPTVDLAVQVYKIFQIYVKGTLVKVGLAAGGNEHFKEEQKRLVDSYSGGKFISTVDILVTTPSRLVHHLVSTEGFSLRYLKFLVIDEADTVLEKDQNDWLYHINKHMDKGNSSAAQRKIWPLKMLFSATLKYDPEKFHSLNLFKPKFFISVDQNTRVGQNYCLPANLKENYIVVDGVHKLFVLGHVLEAKKWQKVLIFTKSNKEAYNLYLLLEYILCFSKAGAITSFQQLKERRDTLEKFKKGEIHILVTTDRMARGIDIPGVKYIISYDTPKYFRTYIHRAGRTARAGERGHVFTLVPPSQVERFIKQMNEFNRTENTRMNININYYNTKYENYIEALKALEAKRGLEKQNEIEMTKAKKGSRKHQ